MQKRPVLIESEILVLLPMKLKKIFFRCNFVTNQMKPVNFPFSWQTQGVNNNVNVDQI